MKRYLYIVFGLALLGLLSGSMLRDLVQTNYLALRTTQTLLSSSQSVDIPEVFSVSCRGRWLMGLIFNEVGDFENRNAEWVSAGVCDPNFIILMHRLVLEDRILALQVQKKSSTSAEVWFWLGDLTPEHAVEYYQHGLELSPKDARRWMTLAGLIEPVDPQAALDALVQACELGDPGENACYGAGNRFLALGDTQSAINILRKAIWQGSLDLADRLEKELNTEK